MMKPDVAHLLLKINRDFYQKFSSSFAETRRQPQPGFYNLLDFLPQPKNQLLDVGCGEGRFGRFLADQKAIASYTGVDFSQKLIRMAKSKVDGQFFIRDFYQSGWQKGLETFDVVACLAALQHIPSVQRRGELLSEMSSLLKPEGRLFLSLWQFLDSERQRRKIIPWEQIGLSTAEVELGDFLISWERDGRSYRYVTYIDSSNLDNLAKNAGLAIENTFRSDGKEGDLNLYAVLRHEDTNQAR